MIYFLQKQIPGPPVKRRQMATAGVISEFQKWFRHENHDDDDDDDDEYLKNHMDFEIELRNWRMAAVIFGLAVHWRIYPVPWGRLVCDTTSMKDLRTGEVEDWKGPAKCAILVWLFSIGIEDQPIRVRVTTIIWTFSFDAHIAKHSLGLGKYPELQ